MTTTEQDRELARKIHTTVRDLNSLLGEAAEHEIEVRISTTQLRKADRESTERILVSVECRKLERLP